VFLLPLIAITRVSTSAQVCGFSIVPRISRWNSYVSQAAFALSIFAAYYQRKSFARVCDRLHYALLRRVYDVHARRQWHSVASPFF